MMDNIYELYHTIDDFKSKALQERQPSLGQAVDNSVVYIMNEDLQPVEVYLLSIPTSINLSI